MSTPALEARDLTLRYDRRLVVDGLDVAVPPGSFTVVVGPNACGKSTLLRGLARLLRPARGAVLLDGTDVASLAAKELARRVGLLPQNPIAPDAITVADLVARGRYPHQRLLRQWSAADARAVAAAMAATGVTALASRAVDELSGGQRQRVWIAMVLAQDTPVLLLDEPTTFLDLGHAVEVLELCAGLRERGRTLVAVLHDLNHACRYASDLVVMHEGRIVAEGAPGEVVTADLVEEVFGLPCRVLDDPESGTPMVVPRSRGGAYTGGGAPMTAARTPTARTVVRGALAGQRRRLVPACLGTIVHQACEAGVPVAIGLVVDRAVRPGSGPGLLWTLVVLAVVFALLTSSMRLGIRRVRAGMLDASHELRLALTRRVLHPGGIDRSQSRSGALLSTATSDADRVGYAVLAVWLMAGSTSALLTSAAVLLVASPLLALVVLAGLVPVYALSRLAARPLERRSGVEQAAAAHAAAVATDFVGGLRVLKGLGAEVAAVARYRDASGRSAHAAVRAARSRAAQQASVLLINGVFLAVVALVAGRLALDGSIGLGAFVSAVGLAQFLVGPFGGFAAAAAMLARASASGRRIAAVLAAPVVTEDPAEAREPLEPFPGHGSLRLRGLAYGPLAGVDLDVDAGECVGVVARDPAVSAALLECLGREAPPTAGVVELDGADVAGLPVDDVRARVLVAAHDAVLFAGTVAENLAAVANDRPVAAAVAAADVGPVAEVLPDGLDTRLGERGRTLSGGQHQRVALARALAADAPVLVLHEPTTAVDPVTEDRIAAGVRDLRRGRTTLLVTTSPALLAVTDRVVVLDDGRVTATGDHHALVRDDAAYRETVLA